MVLDFIFHENIAKKREIFTITYFEEVERNDENMFANTKMYM